MNIYVDKFVILEEKEVLYPLHKKYAIQELSARNKLIFLIDLFEHEKNVLPDVHNLEKKIDTLKQKKIDHKMSNKESGSDISDIISQIDNEIENTYESLKSLNTNPYSLTYNLYVLQRLFGKSSDYTLIKEYNERLNNFFYNELDGNIHSRSTQFRIMFILTGSCEFLNKDQEVSNPVRSDNYDLFTINLLLNKNPLEKCSEVLKVIDSSDKLDQKNSHNTAIAVAKILKIRIPNTHFIEENTTDINYFKNKELLKIRRSIVLLFASDVDNYNYKIKDDYPVCMDQNITNYIYWKNSLKDYIFGKCNSVTVQESYTEEITEKYLDFQEKRILIMNKLPEKNTNFPVSYNMDPESIIQSLYQSYRFDHIYRVISDIHIPNLSKIQLIEESCIDYMSDIMVDAYNRRVEEREQKIKELEELRELNARKGIYISKPPDVPLDVSSKFHGLIMIISKTFSNILLDKIPELETIKSTLENNVKEMMNKINEMKINRESRGEISHLSIFTKPTDMPTQTDHKKHEKQPNRSPLETTDVMSQSKNAGMSISERLLLAMNKK